MMDKPAKPNTIANVLERVIKTFDTIGTGSAPIYVNTLFAQERQAVEEAEGWSPNKKRVELEELEKKEGALARQLTSDVHNALIDFFIGYGINYPVIVKDVVSVRKDLEATLEHHGQTALDAIEGVTRLTSKVVLYTYETRDSRPVVYGFLDILRGVPFAQLSSTPNKSQVELNKRTFRDRVSKLITLFGREMSSGIMLELLAEALPQAAARLRPSDGEVYLRFLDTTLAYLADVYNNFDGINAPQAESIKAVLSELEEKALLPVGEEKSTTLASIRLTPNSVAKLVETAGLKAALESYFGGRVLAVDFTGHSSGVKRQLGIFVAVDGTNPVKHTISYGSSPAPWPVVEALLRLQQQCQDTLKPSDPLYMTNMAAAKSLHHLARR